MTYPLNAVAAFQANQSKLQELKDFLQDIQSCLKKRGTFNHGRRPVIPTGSTFKFEGQVWRAFQTLGSLSNEDFQDTYRILNNPKEGSNNEQKYIKRKLEEANRCYRIGARRAVDRPTSNLLTNRLTAWANDSGQSLLENAEPYIKGEITLGEYLRKRRENARRLGQKLLEISASK